MRKSSMFVLSCLVVLTLIGWSGSAFASSPEEPEDQRILVPDFTLSTNTNETFRLSDHRGSIVVLNFWASWCQPCRMEMPEFQELHEEFADSEGVVLFLLNQIDGRQETAEKGAMYLETNNFTMTNLLDYGTVGRNIFGIPGLPTTVVIDAEGYFFDYAVGATTKAAVLQMIEAAK